MPREIPKVRHANRRVKNEICGNVQPSSWPGRTSALGLISHICGLPCILRRALSSFIASVSAIAINASIFCSYANAQSADKGFAASLYDALGQAGSKFISGSGSGSVVLLALFGGAMSFAIMAASWLIRERNRAMDENRKMALSLAGFKAINERNEALIRVDDQCILVWQGLDDGVEIIGNLSAQCQAGKTKSDVVAFGKWLSPDSASMFEKSVQRLRENAEGFDISLQTKSGRALDAQGRTSGSHAFVRLIELTGERAALAGLEQEHARLLATFESVQSLFDRLSLPVWLNGKNRNLYWVNEAYCRAVDSSDVLEVVEQNVSLFDTAQREEIRAKREDGGYYHGKLPATWAGDRRMLEVFEIQSGDRGVGIAVDRSDVELVRALLKQTVASHSSTLDHMATPIAIFDAERNLEFYNSSFQSMWKLDADFLESKPSNSAVLDAMRDKGRLPSQADWRSWRTEQLAIYQALEPREEWWHLSDGQTVRVVVSPQNQGGATWIYEDVTEELELKSNYNAVLRVQGETLDHLNEAVAVFGSDGKLRLSNPALQNMLQLSQATVEPQQHISKITAEISDKIVESEVWDDIVTTITGLDDARNAGSGRLSLEDGKIIEFTFAPLPDGQTMLTLMDVTSKVNFEVALTERNEALEAAGRIKNSFLQHVSYELRTPLTTIAGFGEMLGMEEMGKLNATQREYLSHINTSSASLKAIIDDILDLATIDAGAMELELTSFDSEEAIGDVVKGLAGRMSERAIDVKISIKKPARELIADQTRFRQIMFNVISNAVDHSPDGSTILLDGSADGGQIRFAVTDQGPGIDKAVLANIFNRFESASRVGRGAGLGLSIVKSFMELHQGSVHAENADGRGARFICEFPQLPDQAQQAAE